MPKGNLPRDPISRGKLIANRDGWVRPAIDPGTFYVRDIATGKTKIVIIQSERRVCSCGPTESLCDHIWAARLKFGGPPDQEAVIQLVAEPTNIDELRAGYRRGQEAEFLWFGDLLSALLESVPEPPRTTIRGGRPRTPLREGLYAAVKRSHEGLSLSRLRGTYRADVEAGHLSAEWNYSLPSRVLSRPELTPILIQLIRDSAKPLIGIEEGGTLAIDSSGFVTSFFGTYFPEAHHVQRRHEFVKGHIAAGTTTNIVTDIIVTDHHGADSPRFESLLRGSVESGFRPEFVVADKAYSSRHNLQVADELGIKPRIPFREGTGSSPKGVRIWRDLWHLCRIDRDGFLDRYHQRSNVEATFSSIKRLLEEGLYSRGPVARRNELLAKVLAYNIVTVIRHLIARGIDPSIVFGARSTGPGPTQLGPGVEIHRPPPISSENTDLLVNEPWETEW